MALVRILSQIGTLTGVVNVPDSIADIWLRDGVAVPHPPKPIDPVHETASLVAPQSPRRGHTLGETR